MRIRRLIALLLTALLLTAAFPAPVAGETAPADLTDKGTAEETAPAGYDEKGQMHADVTVSNGANYAYTFFNYASSHFEGKENSDYKYVETTIYHQANSTAYLSTEEFYMTSGETLSFWYWLESERNYDLFKFIMTREGQDSVVFTESGTSGGGSSGIWIKYTYTCPSSAIYKFTWKYTKDNNIDFGEDCLRIASVQYSQHYLRYILRAGLSAGGYTGDIMTFNRVGDSDYRFYAETSEDSGHELYLVSGNAGHHNTTSAIESKMYVPEAYLGESASTLKFDYKCSSEQIYDKFSLLVDGERVWSVSGHQNDSWQSHEETISGAGVHLIRWEYVKDGSGNGGDDRVCLDNIYIRSELSGYDREYDYSRLNSIYSDADLVFNTPKTYESFRMVSDESGSTYWASCENRFHDSSEAAIMTKVNMDAGEKLSFQYWVSSERVYDRLVFLVNDGEEARFSGWENPQWTTYTFTAPSRGLYTFKWVYHKDSSNSYGFDLARIFDVRYKGSFHNSFTLDEALNAMDSDVQYCFYTDYENNVGTFMPCYSPDGIYCAVSRNAWYESTRSVLGTAPVWLNPGDTLSFSYKVSAESYDKLTFSWDGPTSAQDGSTQFSGETDPSYRRYTFTCNYGGLYSFSWVFAKDSSINQGQDCAFIMDVATTRVSIPGLDEAMNANGSNLHFYNSEQGTHTFTARYDGNTLCAGPANIGGFEGEEDTTATVFTVVYLDAGSSISFQHKYNTETSPVNANGEYVFSVNGVPEFIKSECANTGWEGYGYTAYTSGRYEFGWTYSRKSGAFYDGPIDFVNIRNVCITPSTIPHPDLTASVLGSDTQLSFTSSGFFGDYYDDRECGSSNTYGEGGTTAYLRMSAYLTRGTDLYFSYFYDTEENYDEFSFKVNGETVFIESGRGDWGIFRYSVAQNGNYTFEWSYHKDSTVDSGLDCVKIAGVSLVYTPGGMLGDVDGNGSVDTTDALYALRCALGLVDLDPTALLRADVDMNGSVDTTDALYILRYALGLINEF